MPARRPLGFWFLVGAAAVAVVQAAYAGLHGWNPTVFLLVGDGSPARWLIARDFPGLRTSPALGHDGKYTYLVAREPAFWRADPGTLAALEEPAYRYARPLYPVLAGLGGVLPPAATLGGLVLAQVVAGGVAAAALAAFARRRGLPVAFVVAGLANPGLYCSACLLTPDLTAYALALAGWTFAEARRLGVAAGLFALAVLAKEYHALTPLALAAAFLGEGRWRAAAVTGVVPLVPALGWQAALAAGLGGGRGLGNFTWPGGGVLAAAGGWDVGSWCVGAAGVVLVGGLLATVGAARFPLRLRAAAAAWGGLGLCCSVLVWREPQDLLRAVAPGWWLAAWAAFAWHGRHVPCNPDPARVPPARSAP